MTDMAIIGPGKVGTALGVLAAGEGIHVTAVGARRIEQARAAAERIGDGARPCTPTEAAGAAGLVLLTVNDAAIAALCDELAGAGAFAPGSSVVHCSGALGSDVLASARERCGCRLASMHPLQTFATVDSAVEAFTGTFVFCEGDRAALALVCELVEAVGGRYVEMSSSGKAMYHAAAATACNAFAALVDAALAMFEYAGIDRDTALEAVGPLVRATADNIIAMGPERALTGPVARGETQTLVGHVRALAAADEDVRQLYLAAARHTITLARRKGTIDNETAARMRQILDMGRTEHGSTDH